MQITPATSYQVLVLLAGDMDQAEREAVWALVRYLREKEVRMAKNVDGPTGRQAQAAQTSATH
jgi:hypothetical protein